MKAKINEQPQAAMNGLKVFEYKSQLVADSRDVALFVEKDHKHLLRDIRRYAKVMEQFNESKVGLADTASKHLNGNKFVVADYFVEASYVDEKGETRPCYYCTEMGCEFIAHKMTGDRGIIFTAQYVKAFHAMRDLLMERQSAQWQQARAEGKTVRRMETDAVKAFAEYAAASGSNHPEQYYIHFTRLAHKAVGIADGQRNQLSTAQLLNLQMSEQVIDRAIWSELASSTEYHSAFQNVKEKVQQLTALAFSPRQTPRAALY